MVINIDGRSLRKAIRDAIKLHLKRHGLVSAPEKLIDEIIAELANWEIAKEQF